MKSAFKPLGIATAVAAASIGQVHAQPEVASNFLGDLALVPYYTVNDGWVTAIHIVNTSDATQVVKFRFRRATDSMDALDFNIVMSPKDVYAGFLNDEGGTITWQADDTTCTVPATTDGKLTMPSIYRPDAETGYVEIIAMGQPVDEDEPIAYAAKHVDDVPRDCAAVRSNFFADGTPSRNGVVDNATAWQDNSNLEYSDPNDMSTDGDSSLLSNEFEDSGNVLKVSYSITDIATGIEFGDNAVHIEDFIESATITNQQFGYFSGDLNGFDFPDLNGPEPVNLGGERGTFTALRSTDVLGVESLANEWSSNPANEVATDWVVTLPGQYTMFKLPEYVDSMDGSVTEGFDWVPTLENGSPTNNPDCPRLGARDADGDLIAAADICDWRDMPVELEFQAWNREEFGGASPEEGLTVSPAPPGEITTAFLPKEANVITFGDTGGVLDAEDTNITADLRQPFGWLAVSVSSRNPDAIGLCDWVGSEDNGNGPNGEPFPSNAAGADLTKNCVPYTSANAGGVPVIGFAAWARSIASNPDGSYGRIIAHSSVVSAAP